jgi:hypothetical protein
MRLLCTGLCLGLTLIFLLVGCTPDRDILEVSMFIHEAQVEEVGKDFVTLTWKTSVPGDTRADLALLTQDATGETNPLEAVSDLLYLPRRDGGGVTFKDPRIETVSNTRVHNGPPTLTHWIRVDRLLAGRTYAAMISSISSVGEGQAQEFGAPLVFTTTP